MAWLRRPWKAQDIASKRYTRTSAPELDGLCTPPAFQVADQLSVDLHLAPFTTLGQNLIDDADAGPFIKVAEANTVGQPPRQETPGQVKGIQVLSLGLFDSVWPDLW